MKINLSDEQANKIIVDLFESYPEASGGMALKCQNWNYKNFKFIFFDEEEEKEYTITKKDALRGLKAFIEASIRGEHCLSLDFENSDAYTCDAIVQYAIFNKLIYG